jgi:signal transduction histidine kinase
MGPAPTASRMVPVAAGALAIPAGVGAAMVIVTSDMVDFPVATASLTVLAAWAFVGGGAVAWVSRPGNRVGPLMVVAGLLLLVGSLSAADEPFAFTVGVLLAPISTAVFAHLLLAFPSGRLGSSNERVVVGLAYADATALQLLMLFFMDYRTVRGCPCPRNLLFVQHADQLHSSLMTIQRVLALGIVLTIVVILVRRWRRASPPLRRSLGPVLVTGTVAAVLSGCGLVLTQVSDSSAGDVVGLAATLAIAFVPLGFLTGLLRTRLARAAVGELVLELGGPMAPGELGGALAKALGDPSLELVYRRPDSETYVDLAGEPVPIPEPSSSRAVSYVLRDGRRIAAVLHDPALREDPHLVESACTAAGLAIDNERLHAELRARLADLRASRARLVDATEVERRRIERDLHDGTQQRLVSIGMTLGLLEARLSDAPETKPLVDEARTALASTLSELRDLTQGIYPAVLTERGLSVALDELCRRSAIPASLVIQTDPAPSARSSDSVEAAAYYVVSEALTNAAKHSGAASAHVTVGWGDHRLTVAVADDGVGGAAIGGGTGLRGLTDRVEALGGHLTVDSPPGRGTVLSVELPCE